MIKLMPRLVATDPNICYLICGKGGDRPNLERLAADRGVLDKIVFAGMIAEEEKADHYRLADVYVMPSRGEGFGFVFLEAMACGVPVIGSSLDGGAEALRGGELGMLIPPSSAHSLEVAVRDLLSRNERWIPHGLEYFSFAHFASRLADIVATAARV